MSAAGIFGGVLLGAVIGVISGLIGIGGGAFLMPALVYFYGMSQMRAQGTSIGALLLPIGALAFWTYYKAGHVDIRLSLLIAAGITVGGWAGAEAAQHLSAMVLRRCFAAMLMLLAVRLIFER